MIGHAGTFRSRRCLRLGCYTQTRTFNYATGNTIGAFLLSATNPENGTVTYTYTYTTDTMGRLNGTTEQDINGTNTYASGVTYAEVESRQYSSSGS